MCIELAILLTIISKVIMKDLTPLFPGDAHACTVLSLPPTKFRYY